MTDNEHGSSKVRIDKWLWAARFFKTRSLAKTAIEGGKVLLVGQKVKVSREVAPGDMLRIRQGWDEREVKVIATSEQRRAAPTPKPCTKKPRRASKDAPAPQRRAWRQARWQDPHNDRVNMNAKHWNA